MSVSFSNHNALPNLRAAFPYPESPWKYSEEVYKRLQKSDLVPGSSFKMELVRPSDPDFDVVLQLFLAQKHKRYSIKAMYAVRKDSLVKSFKNHLQILSDEANDPTYDPTWRNSPNETTAQREAVIDRYNTIKRRYRPQSLKEKELAAGVCVFPVWHGFDSVEIGKKICNNGFSAPGSGDGAHRNDPGWYGNGIYFSTSSKYALGYSKGSGRRLILGMVSIRGEPFPIVGADYPASTGKPLKEWHTAHYIPVANFFPTIPNKKAECDEIVVNNRSQTLPMFLIDVQEDTPFQGVNLDQITMAWALADYLMYHWQRNFPLAQDQTTVFRARLTDLFLREIDTSTLLPRDKLFLRLFKIAIQQNGDGAFSASEAAEWLPAVAEKTAESSQVLKRDDSTRVLIGKLIRRRPVMAAGGVGILLIAALAYFTARNIFSPTPAPTVLSSSSQQMPLQIVQPPLLTRISENAPSISFDPHGEGL